MTVLALEGQWSGGAAIGLVLTILALLIGSIYVLLTGVLGARKAYLVLGTSLFGFIILLSLVWMAGAPGTTPGTGPRGTEPSWVPFLAESEQGEEFQEVLATFPQRWDRPGRKYSGGVESAGEIEKVRPAVQEALARLAAFEGREATDPKDWSFRLEGVKPASPEEVLIPVGAVRFVEAQRLLAGITIPGTDKHPTVTVFAFRDKGRIFQPSALFLGSSVVLFALHLAGLARIERKEKEAAAAPSPAAREPAPTG